MAQYQEGQRAINEATGEIKIFQNGAWVSGGNTGKEGINSSAPGAGYLTSSASRKITAPVEKELSGYRKGAQNALGARSQAMRFEGLNKENRTGGMMNALAPVRGMFDAGYREMDAIAKKLTPSEREAGSGAMSDKDVAMYQAATLSPTNPRATNDAISRVIRAGAVRQADHSAFMEEWAKRNGGLTGAQEAWTAYSDANPLYRVEGGNTQVNGWTPWRKWFGVEMAKPAAQAQPARSAAPQAQRPSLGSIFGN